METERPEHKSMFVSVCIAIALALTVIFAAGAAHTRKMAEQGFLNEGRALFNSVMMTRQWNSRHGGVYVEKNFVSETLPFMASKDIKTVDGREFIIQNHSIMSHEISEIARFAGMFYFRMTSLKPINTANAPDAFERKALEEFEKGSSEETSYESSDDRTWFRYMGPLRVDRECLECHAQQGYKEGDIRGGVSVTFEVTEVLLDMKKAIVLQVLAGMLSVGMLAAAVAVYTRRLRYMLSKSKGLVKDLAIKDPLTGIYNRRYVLERFEQELQETLRLGNPLSCLIFDVDRFKLINDTHGHLAGDKVLAEVSGRIIRSLRAYDIVGRYGGEEFLVVLPGTDRHEARAVAEKLRAIIDSEEISAGGGGIKTTASFGVASFIPGDAYIENMLRRADLAMYRAKKEGRNCVMTDEA